MRDVIKIIINSREENPVFVLSGWFPLSANSSTINQLITQTIATISLLIQNVPKFSLVDKCRADHNSQTNSLKISNH